MTTLFYVCWVLSWGISVFHLILQKRAPLSSLAWIFFVTLVPILGPIIYALAGPQRLERKASKLKDKRGPTHVSFSDSLERTSLHWRERNVLSMASQISQYDVTQGNEVEFFDDQELLLEEMAESIRNAKKTVHLQYYIIATDEVTRNLSQDLIDAAKRGVDVRVLYDAFGSFFLKKVTLRRLTKGGVKLASFLPFTVFPNIRYMNFRNHRKILVVDGTQAFTSGVNIGKQYLGRKNKKQWHDYGVRVTGPTCSQLQDVFARDWHFATHEVVTGEIEPPAPTNQKKSTIQVLESGPDSEFHALHKAVFLAINSAENSITMTTPYFIPDSAILTAMTVAALRGVRVKIILPAKSDAPHVQWAGRSFYDELIDAGVEIYEYQPRILHAKLMVIDEKWTLLGSGNMDIRSFRLNFELNLLVLSQEFSAQCETSLNKDIEDSERIVPSEFMNRSIRKRLIENTCRLFSPVM